MESALTLGIDLGTSAVKVELLSADGRSIASGSGEHPTLGDGVTAEQRPADWEDSLSIALGELSGQADSTIQGWRDQLGGVGIAGQLPTLVSLRDDEVHGNAITWKDGRRDIWASEALNAIERASLYQKTGMPIDGRYLGPMYLHHGPKNGATTILSAKDYLVWRLTGALVTDPSTAAGYATYDLDRGCFDESLCKKWNLSSEQMPSIAPALHRAGSVSEKAAARFGLPKGLPVTVGCADSVAGGYAMTGLTPGRVSVAMGSSTIILATTLQASRDPNARCLITPHLAPGFFALEMDLIATGTGYAWLSGLLGATSVGLDILALRSSPGARGLQFRPYLGGGEQGALWNPQLRGSLHGLCLQHDAGDIARAYFEGVAFEIRRCLDVIEERQPVQEVVLSGLAVQKSAAMRLYADALGVSVRPCTLRSAAARGAALSARPLAGLPPISSGTSALPAVEPGPDRLLYRDLYTAYRAGD